MDIVTTAPAPHLALPRLPVFLYTGPFLDRHDNVRTAPAEALQVQTLDELREARLPGFLLVVVELAKLLSRRLSCERLQNRPAGHRPTRRCRKVGQRIGRIYRLGQRRPIDVYNLVSEPGIESRIADLVGSKQALFTGLFDGTTDEVAFERSGSFLSRIERIVAPALGPAAPRGKEAADVEDDPAEREIEALVTAGDESRDAPAPTAPEPTLTPSAADVQRLFSGLTVQRTGRRGLVIEAPPETASTLAALFGGMAQLLQAAATPAAPSLAKQDGAVANTGRRSARPRAR
ncbi:MAG TPA: hypothetical protein VLD67_07555 [Vicinamibacterales bacterium]|nr:hypothetical protein [Vicinamibacterales bacterium]